MVVISHQVTAGTGKRVGFPDKLECAAGIGREDHGILAGIGGKEVKHGPARAFDQFGTLTAFPVRSLHLKMST